MGKFKDGQLWKLSLSQMDWTKLGTSGPNVGNGLGACVGNGPQIASLGSHLVAITGSECLQIDPTTMLQTGGCQGLPGPAATSRLVAVGSALYLFDTCPWATGDSHEVTVWRFQLNVWTERVLNLSCKGFSLVTMDLYIYIVENHHEIKGLEQLEIWRFSTESEELTKLSTVGPPELTGRVDFALAAVDSKIYFHGGRSDGGYSKMDDLWQLCTETLRWTQLNVAAGVRGLTPEARSAHTLTAVGSNLYLFGGLSGDIMADTLSRSQELWVFSIPGLEWKFLDVAGGLSGGRAYHSATLLLGTIYVLGTDSDPFLNGIVNDECQYLLSSLSLSQTVDWPETLADFTRIYDGDIISPSSDVDWRWKVDLCSRPFLPCALTIQGTDMSVPTIRRHGSGQIQCDLEAGCSSVDMLSVNVSCDTQVATESQLKIIGSSLSMSSVTFSGCKSIADGGIVLAYSGASVHADRLSITHASSQVKWKCQHLNARFLPRLFDNAK